jgi:hypothetical protein
MRLLLFLAWLVLATAGLLLTLLGWILIAVIFWVVWAVLSGSVPLP